MRNLKRALSLGLTAAMISGLMVMGSSAAGYADVTSEQNQEAIEVLQAVGIMVGDNAGNFNPDATVSRNEMAVVMANLLEYNVASYANTSPFTDVPEWAEPYVAACWTNGITAGYSDTIYGGSDSVTTAQAALMLMKALGYFQYQQDFGSDWQLATIAKGNDIDLFDDVDSGVREAMTRNDLAQLVLNTLEAGTVRASTSGSITVGGVTVATSVEYKYVTSTRSYASAIGRTQDTTQSSDAQAYVVELGESLYQGELKKTESQDDFGRPANIWEYQSKEIGTYADAADATWTTRVNERDLYSAAGSAAVNEYTWYVYEDGALQASFDYEDGDDLMPSRSSSDRWNGTGNGILTEVFVDVQHDEVIVTKVNTYLAEVTKVVENDDDYTVTVSYKTQPSGSVSREFDTTTEFAREDIVLVTLAGEAGSTKEIQSLDLAKTVEGTVTAVRNADYVRMDGTTYNYNYGYTGASRILAALYDLDDNNASGKNPEAGDECTIYLDLYGNAIAVENADITADDYLYVTGVDSSYGDVSAKAIFADGTEKVIDIDELNGNDNVVIGSASSGEIQLTTGVYRFSQSGSKYDLVSAENDAVNANSSADYWTYDLDDGTYAGKIEKGNAAFFADYQNSSTYGAAYTADSNTVFVDTDKNASYTGYAEVPSMSDVKGWVVTENSSAGGKAEIVFITNAPEYDLDDDSFFFVKDLKSEEEDTEDGSIYRWNIVSTAEDNKLTASSDLAAAANSINKLDEKGLYQIKSYDSDNYVTKVEYIVDVPDNFDPTTGKPYATTASNGILILDSAAGNKLSSGNTTATSFSYTADTTFMVVEMDKAKGEVGDVYTVNSPSMIETYETGSGADNTDLTAVYVINADDKDDAAPKATLVLVVVPDTRDQDASYAVTYPATLPTGIQSLTVTANGNPVSNGATVPYGTTLTITATPANGYSADISVNSTSKGAGPVSYTVVGTTAITLTATNDSLMADNEYYYSAEPRSLDSGDPSEITFLHYADTADLGNVILTIQNKLAPSYDSVEYAMSSGTVTFTCKSGALTYYYELDTSSDNYGQGADGQINGENVTLKVGTQLSALTGADADGAWYKVSTDDTGLDSANLTDGYVDKDATINADGGYAVAIDQAYVQVNEGTVNLNDNANLAVKYMVDGEEIEDGSFVAGNTNIDVVVEVVTGFNVASGSESTGASLVIDGASTIDIAGDTNSTVNSYSSGDTVNFVTTATELAQGATFTYTVTGGTTDIDLPDITWTDAQA